MARYRFIVEDNGYGMSEEYQKKIFQPFTREEDAVTNRIQGSGLGMVITKSLMDLMNGTITVSSKKGEGSTFAVELDLPISDADIDLDFWKKHRITKMLVVDDEEVVCQNIQMAMEGTEVSVEYSLDGQTALDIRVKSTPGKGSTFTVELDIRILVKDADPRFWMEHQVGRMLIVDDDEAACRVIVNAMAKSGVSTDYAASGDICSK